MAEPNPWLDAFAHRPRSLAELFTTVRVQFGRAGTSTAALLGVSRSFVSDVENGRRSPALSTLVTWAPKLGVPLPLLVQLAFQAELDRCGFKMRVTVREEPAHA